MNKPILGKNVTIGEKVMWGKNITVGHNCIIEDEVTIGDNAYIESNTIIRSYSRIGINANIGSNCIIGEHLMNFYKEHKNEYTTSIGNNALIRSGSVIYADSLIGSNFQTGHHVTIRERTTIGDNVSIGTLSDIQGNCNIGSFVRMHSNVHIGQQSIIDSFVWIFPYVVLTNDPTPPSENFLGVHIYPFAIVSTGSIILPGLDIGQDSLVGAGAIVTKSVSPYSVVVGNPAKAVSDVREIRNRITGEQVYPWRYHFSNYMPWEGVGFDAWFESLSNKDIQVLRLNHFCKTGE